MLYRRGHCNTIICSALTKGQNVKFLNSPRDLFCLLHSNVKEIQKGLKVC